MTAIAELFDQALRLYQTGNLAQAEALFRQVIQADPRHVDAHQLLGILAHQAGRHEAGIALLRQAISLNPAGFGGYFNLGIVLMNVGQFAEAASCFRSALEREPNHVEAYIYLGNALAKQRQLDQAIACYRHALSIQPLHADAHINLGNALKDQGNTLEAIQCFREALRINPRHSQGFNNLGNAYLDQGLLDDACTCFRQALSLDPANAKAHYNLGNVLQAQGNLAAAAECYRQTLRCQPLHVDAYNNLGVMLREQGQLTEAALCVEQALAIEPTNGLALLNRAHLRLLQGNFAEGWPDFENRSPVPGIARRSFEQPRWDGSSFEGRTLLVHAELGLGDTIQFLRFLPLVKRRGGIVLFECQRALVPLLTGVAGVDRIFAADTPLPPFDLYIPLLSLPLLFGTTINNIPAEIPYLTVHPELAQHWRQELARHSLVRSEPKAAAVFSTDAAGAGLNIGITWYCNPNHPGYRVRSVSLGHFAALAALEGVRLFSLQVGPELKEQFSSISFPLIDLGSRFNPNSLEDLAAVIMNLDLIVTVDTAVAHIAGALGVPTWVVLSNTADWRWLQHRSDSPWYPTLRLFRQTRFGDWAGVFERVTTELQSHPPNNGDGAAPFLRRPDWVA
jgi:tetratricopeptide (TPR) repeat protein